jgi:hypothetical protein
MTPDDKALKRAEQIALLKKVFAQAEAKESECSHLIGSLNVIPINQLRYVSFHLLASLNEKGEWDEEITEEHLKLAINHCSRACCDSLDITASWLLQNCEVFTSQFMNTKEVKQVIHDYKKKIETIIKMQKRVEDYNNRRTHDDQNYHFELEFRLKHMDELSPYINEVQDILYIFKEAGPSIDHLRNQNRVKFVFCYFVIPVITGMILLLINICLMS